MKNYEKPDFWTQKARKEGYPARSVYKLEEILKKERLFSAKAGKQSGILDLGAAPGSWSLYLLRAFGASVNLVSCDLLPLSREFDAGLFEGGNFLFVRGDFTKPETKAVLLERGLFDVILSDAAPATTGNRLVDTARSMEIAETVLEYARAALRTGGSIAVKLFQGEMTSGFSHTAAPLFEKWRMFKPEACRAESFESYFIGKGFRRN